MISSHVHSTRLCHLSSLQQLIDMIPKTRPRSQLPAERPAHWGVPRLLCTKTRFVSIAAIPHILFHMCRQIGFALRATTKRGGLPSGFAAGMACRRFDLKVGLQAIRLLFDIPAPSTFVKRRRAIPTFGSRQAPRHEPGFARHEYPRMNQCKTSSQGVSF